MKTLLFLHFSDFLKTDNMMNQLRAEVGYEMGVEYQPEPKQQQQIEQNNAFYDELKKI